MILLVRPYMLLFLVHQPENAHASEAWSEGKKNMEAIKSTRTVACSEAKECMEVPSTSINSSSSSSSSS